MNDAACRGNQHPSFTVQNDTCVDDGEDVHKGKYTIHTSRYVDNASDEKDIDHNLYINKEFQVVKQLQQENIEKSQEVNSPDERIEVEEE